MQITSSNLARLNIHDRNPSSDGMGTTFTSGPHGNTSQATHTVPAGRKARIDAVTYSIARVTAAAPHGNIMLLIRVTPNGEAAQNYYRSYSVLPAVDDIHEDHFALGAVLSEGDLIEFRTEDLSTGGTCFYALGMVLTEFDA